MKPEQDANKSEIESETLYLQRVAARGQRVNLAMKSTGSKTKQTGRMQYQMEKVIPARWI